MKFEYLLLCAVLFFSCSKSIVLKSTPLDANSYNVDDLVFNVQIGGNRVASADLAFNILEIDTKYKKSGVVTRDTVVDISFDKLVFRVSKERIGSVNKIEYDNRLFRKTHLPKQNIFFAKKYFVFDIGLDDVYLIPLKK